MNMLYLSRILAGFFAANVSAAMAYIADVTDQKDRAKGMGLIGAAFGLGFTFGPAIGGILSQHRHAWLGDTATSLPSMPGFLAAALSLCAALFGWLKLSEPQTHARDATRLFDLHQLGAALRDRRVGTLIILNFMVIFAWAGFEGMFTRFGLAVFPTVFHQPVAIQNATMDDTIVAGKYAGYYMFFIGIVSAFIQGGLIRRLVPRFGEVKLLVAGPFFLAIALAVIGLSGVGRTWLGVMIGCALLPCGFGLSNPSIAGLMSRAAPDERQGSYLGMSQAAGSLARAVGPFVAGWLFGFAPMVPFFAGAGLLLVATLIAMGYRGRYAATFPQDAVRARVAPPAV
jgi:DHA1 family tetracycline resistance protein-like MFS transporter